MQISNTNSFTNLGLRTSWIKFIRQCIWPTVNKLTIFCSTRQSSRKCIRLQGRRVMMEVAYSSEMLVKIYETTQRHSPEDRRYCYVSAVLYRTISGFSSLYGKYRIPTRIKIAFIQKYVNQRRVLKLKLRGRSPQANYTDREIAACRRS
jgi:hypothetical protein